jgi:hypothetical protein
LLHWHPMASVPTEAADADMGFAETSVRAFEQLASGRPMFCTQAEVSVPFFEILRRWAQEESASRFSAAGPAGERPQDDIRPGRPPIARSCPDADAAKGKEQGENGHAEPDGPAPLPRLPRDGRLEAARDGADYAPAGDAVPVEAP